MRNPLLQKMRQEFDYGNIYFLRGFVQRFYDKTEQEFPFGYYYGVPPQEYDYKKGGSILGSQSSILGSQRPNLSLLSLLLLLIPSES